MIFDRSSVLDCHVFSLKLHVWELILRASGWILGPTPTPHSWGLLLILLCMPIQYDIARSHLMTSWGFIPWVSMSGIMKIRQLYSLLSGSGQTACLERPHSSLGPLALDLSKWARLAKKAPLLDGRSKWSHSCWSSCPLQDGYFNGWSNLEAERKDSLESPFLGWSHSGSQRIASASKERIAAVSKGRVGGWVGWYFRRGRGRVSVYTWKSWQLLVTDPYWGPGWYS